MGALPEVIDGIISSFLNGIAKANGWDHTDLSALADQGTGTHTPIPEGASSKDVKSAILESKSAPQAGGGGGKKKKKGKK